VAKFFKCGVKDKVPEGSVQRAVPLFLEMTEFPFNTVQDGCKEARMPKTSSICSSVSIEHRLVTDTDGHWSMGSTSDA